MLKLIKWYEDGDGINEEVIETFATEDELKKYLQEEKLALYCDDEDGLGVREDGFELLWYEF